MFSELQKPLRTQLERLGVTEPSDIQRIAIPKILAGENVLVIAPTGTGKTLASVLPIFDMFVSARSGNETKGISILYVTPLRALNRDILRRLAEVGAQLDIKVQVRHGDTPTSVRALQARSPPNMLITTPETLQAILPGRKMREHLRGVRWVVVDEIHELATDERGTQLVIGLERLRELTGRDFQRVGLSATIGDPGRVGLFLVGNSRKVLIAKSDETRNFEVTVEYVPPTKDDERDARNLGLPPSSIARIKRIAQLIKEKRSTLVFTNTREQAEAVGSQLLALSKDLPVRVHHGSLSREIREEVEQDFQAGKVKAVICTSSLELGIDVGNVDYIIQYMSPRDATKLVQRVGRSGHQLKGLARGVIISSFADDILESGILSRKAMVDELEEVKIHENALDVLAHQIVGLCLDRRRIAVDEALGIVTRAYPFRDMTAERFMAVVKQLENIRTIRLLDNILVPRFPKAFTYYYGNLSVIPDVKRYTVFDFIRKRRLGSLDEDFVARRCKSGTEFIMHGHTWKVISVDEGELKVEVEPTAPSLDALPSWEGEIIPVSYSAATQAGHTRERLIDSEAIAEGTLKELADLPVQAPAAEKIAETIRAHAKDFVVPTDKRIVIEKFENAIVVHSCFGNLVNEALSICLAAILSAKFGVNVATQTDPYRIALISPFKIEVETVANVIRSLTPDDLDAIVRRALEESELFAWRQWHVARRFGLVERHADYKAYRARTLVEALRGTPVHDETEREIFLEKIDLERARNVVSGVRSGSIAVDVIQQRKETCSPLALPILDKVIPHDLLRPAVPTRSFVEIIKERLLSANTKLVCMFQGDWEGIRAVKDAPDHPRCPRCKSTLVAATYQSDDKLLKIVKKRKRGEELSPEEKAEWERGSLSASLVQNSGKKAIIVMAGRGVGPTTATRILRRPHRTEDDLYLDILRAEREYARTRLFWD
jgi:ATP-dependent Lhr-like helicase